MPRLKRGLVILMLACLGSRAAPGSAETSEGPTTAAADGIYRPATPLQRPPLRVEVLDGRRFRDVETGEVYRLYGIDTCALRQSAQLGRQPWPCGTIAAAWLVTATLNRWLSCVTVRVEAGELLARCASAAHPDLAADMLKDGVAVMLPPGVQEAEIRAYAAAEREARKAYRGLWASTFQMPWEFRAGLARGAVAAAGDEAER